MVAVADLDIVNSLLTILWLHQQQAEYFSTMEHQILGILNYIDHLLL
jgi:hypothetical protein